MKLRVGRLRRSDRLRRRREFERVSRAGRRCASRGFVVLIAPLESPGSGEHRGGVSSRAGPASGQRRLGITASRRVGNAVTRNRMKRAIREWFRHHRDELEENVDIVVIVRRQATALESNALEKELSSVMRRARRVADEANESG